MKGIASVVSVDILLKESAMIAHVVRIFTKDQVLIFEYLGRRALFGCDGNYRVEKETFKKKKGTKRI